jgi:hypothetical protein
VVFFHHPFEEPVFLRVIEKLERSLAACPRPMIVAYLDPRCAHVFDTSTSFKRRKLPDCLKSTMPVALFDNL